MRIQAVTTRTDTANVKDYSAEKSADDHDEETSNKKEELVVAFIAAGDTAKMRVVETGIQDDRYIEILKGINPDEEVIVAPFSAVSKKLKNDDLLEIVPFEKLFEDDKKKK